MSIQMQFYNNDERRVRMFPRLSLAITEAHFIASLNTHVKYLNNLVTARVEGRCPRELYNSWSMYSAFFPRLSTAHNGKAFDFFLKITVNEMKSMIDSIVTEKNANEYIKLFKNSCNEVYDLQAMERIARQEKEALEEASEEFQQEFEEPEAEFDDITNEHYDAVLSLEKKCNKRIRHGCDNSEEKFMQQVKVLPANFAKEIQLELENVDKPLLKKTKWEENKLAKRKLSKLRLKRQDKSIVDHKNIYDCVEDERDDVYLDLKSLMDDYSFYSYSSFESRW
jgi:hypothetical protein